MPPRKTPTGAIKKTVRKSNKRARTKADRLVAVNRERSPLLRLPAELRNRIYEYALIEANIVALIPDSREPPLLHTCRQIRSEALTLYYMNNEFHILVADCDARLLGAFARRYETIDTKGKEMDLGPVLTGQPNWDNLMAWCKEVHASRCFALRSANGQSGNMNEVAAAATSTAAKLYETPWEKCVEVLDTLRHVAGLVDAAWKPKGAEV